MVVAHGGFWLAVEFDPQVTVTKSEQDHDGRLKNFHCLYMNLVTLFHSHRIRNRYNT